MNYKLLLLSKGGVARDEYKRQINREDTVLSGKDSEGEHYKHPLQPPTGERTRKTYDFTSK